MADSVTSGKQQSVATSTSSVNAITYDVHYNPKNGCTGTDAFSVSIGSVETRGYTQTPSEIKNGFSLKDFAYQTIAGGFVGGVTSTAFYGIGKAIGKSKTAIKTQSGKNKHQGDSIEGTNNRKSRVKTYQTYTKTNPSTGEVYSGRTSGYGSPYENIRTRDAKHHMNSNGFGPAVLDKTSHDYNAIRGREQMLIEKFGGAKSVGGTSGNAINGIASSNKKKSIYIEAEKTIFGDMD